MIQAQHKYRELCKKETDIPLFSQAWWLDAVVGPENWGVSLVEKSGEIAAALPYTLNRKWGMAKISQPVLTPFLGPWYKIYAQKNPARIAAEKEYLDALFAQLPPHVLYRQNWHYRFQNWLPLYWQGYEQFTQYSYVINDLRNIGAVWDNFTPSARTTIRRAQDKHGLTVSNSFSMADFYELNARVFARQKIAAPYSLATVESIHAATQSRDASKFFVARDSKGVVHAAAYVVWDRNSAYYLMGAGHPDLQNSGAQSLCLWEAIKFAATVTQKFDFEGSMIAPIERFFRDFGGAMQTFMGVRKVRNPILKAYYQLRGIW